MCLSATAIATIGLGISAGSTIYNIDQQRSAAKKQRRANQIQRNTQEVQAREQRDQSMRERRIRRARVLNAAAGSDSTTSSSITGSLGAFDSSLASNFAFSSTMAMGADRVTQLNQDAQQNLFNAELGSMVGQIGASMFSNPQAYTNLFTSAPKGPGLA